MRKITWLSAWPIFAWCMLYTSPVAAGEVYIPLGPMSGGMTATVKVKSITELRDEGVVRQQLDFSCGAAAAATIFSSYLGVPCTEREVIDFIIAHNDAHELILKQGFTLLDLKQFAESKGVKATGYRLTFELLTTVKQPILLPILMKGRSLRHFVVYLDSKDDIVFLADPARGRLSMKRADFEQEWDLKIGMVFTKPNAPAISQTPLAVRPIDLMSLPASEVLSVALPPTTIMDHTPREF